MDTVAEFTTVFEGKEPETEEEREAFAQDKSTPKCSSPPISKNNYKWTVTKNISYYDGDDRDTHKHCLNVYTPVKDGNVFLKEGKLPVVVFVHGGGWQRGDRNYFYDIYGKVGEYFAREGFVSPVVSYRLAPTHKHPHQVTDVARAIRWVHENIEKFGGDLERVYLCGHSAGAHLSALVSLDARWLQHHGIEKSFIKGVVGLCGIYDLQLFSQGGFGWTRHVLGLVFRNGYLYKAFGREESIWTEASPTTYVHKDAPPFLLLNAETDFGFEEHTKLLSTSLNSLGVPVKTGVIKGTRHGSLIGMSFQYFGMGPPKDTMDPVIEFLTELALRSQ